MPGKTFPLEKWYYNYGEEKEYYLSIAIAKHLNNARNRLTNNDKDIVEDNDIHGIPYPFTKAKFHNFQRRMTYSLE